MSGKTPVKIGKANGMPPKVVAGMKSGVPKRTAMSSAMKPKAAMGTMVKGLK